MEFIVGSAPRQGPPNTAYLVPDGWDDWFSFRTMFSLVVFDGSGQRHDIGSVKIGERGLVADRATSPGRRAPTLPERFNHLEDHHFSLGQSDDYYESLNALGPENRDVILRALQDCASDLSKFRRHRAEPVMQTSLLRSLSESRVSQRFNRLAHGDAALTDYQFEYSFPTIADAGEQPRLSFQVIPQSEPPTNIHVIIGRNGVGKTRCLTNLTQAILLEEPRIEENGKISAVVSDRQASSFSGLVVVSFSAFDEFNLPRQVRTGIQAHRVGIHAVSQGGTTNAAETAFDAEARHEITFAEAFKNSLERCLGGLRFRRLRDAIATLETDPLFAEANLSGLMAADPAGVVESLTSLFGRMSSGHKIVLLSITRLVELVDERTLVLLDEPEGHLHPPLLSAFVRALSDLLVKRNGVAIISTHSPVVLQEVPKSCVWLLWRSGREARAARPEIETFGENVGILTREVFGLEVTNAGFHQLLKSAVNESNASFDSVMAKFGGQLGAEAQAVVRSLLAIKASGAPQ